MTFFSRAKSPGASVGHSIDWSNDLGSGVTISSSTWTVTSGSGSIASSGISGSTTTVQVAGGGRIKPIVVRNTVQASDGQTYDKSVTIPTDST